ncbi:unnamed protein product [Parnassius apollo]|uniref:(apollo) hypothetical protein n=1 Tax=Parnassius apollo TaxID=110799 RepID=A0A8S3WYW4_PARAO|nr:unnamed protein product [Parnassius apollo]
MNDKSTSIQFYDSENLLPQQTLQDLEKTERQEIEEEPDILYSCNQLSYGDAVFATFVVAPLVVGVWRSTWSIMDLHSKLFPYAQIYLLGIIIHICFALIRSHLLSRSIATSDENRYFHWLRERLLSRIYTYIFILSCIMHWRGGWGLFDGTVAAVVPSDADPHRPVLIAALTVLCYASIASLRSARNLLASPYFLVTDGKEPTYIFTTRFRNVGQVSILLSWFIDRL